MKYISYLGILILLVGLYLAFITHSSIWYSFFLVGGFLFLEGINSRYNFSVLKNRKAFIHTWLIFIILTLITELLGLIWLHAWEYPSFDIFDYIIHVILIGYPFTAFLGMEVFILIKRNFPKKSYIAILPTAAIIFGYLNEIPNIFTYEWKYHDMILGNFLGIPILISILWLLILIVQLFEKPFLDKQKINS